MKRLRVYIAGPITKGDLAHNIAQAEAAFYTLLRAGFAPFCPHWSCYGSGPRVSPGGSVYAVAAAVHPGTTAADWYEVDLQWVETAAALVRLPGESRGADLEVEHAVAHGVPVFRSVAALLDLLGRPAAVPG